MSRSRELLSNEKTYCGFLWFKSEVASHSKTLVKVVCDICGKKYEWERSDFIGMYTGWKTFELKDYNVLAIEWGYKGSRIDVCKTHKELEIEQKIKELKEAE